MLVLSHRLPWHAMIAPAGHLHLVLGDSHLLSMAYHLVCKWSALLYHFLPTTFAGMAWHAHLQAAHCCSMTNQTRQLYTVGTVVK